jgi:hypothetical protein
MSLASLAPALKGLGKGLLTWFSKPANRKLAGEVLSIFAPTSGGLASSYTDPQTGKVVKTVAPPSLLETVASGLQGKRKRSVKRKKRY